MDQIKFQLVDVDRTLAQLQALERKVQKRVLRKAVKASTGVMHKEARRLAPRSNGFLRMSLKVVVRSGRKAVFGRVGQEKNRTFKRKRTKGSQINRRGFAAPIHWIERGTKSHEIRPSGKALAWTAGRRKGSKGQARFARRVRHPGMAARRLLENTARTGASAAAAAFNQVCADELAKLPAPGESQS